MDRARRLASKRAIPQPAIAAPFAMPPTMTIFPSVE
jgi:hypothetical protein